jgi:hypothetical protein
VTDQPLDEQDSAELEASLVASAGVRGTEDEGAITVWLHALGARPGSYQSVPTADAWAVYCLWAESVGVVPLAPFVFARRMLTIFDKRASSWRGLSIGCYKMCMSGAKRLRAQSRAHPPSPEQLEQFSFNALRVARHPARKTT